MGKRLSFKNKVHREYEEQIRADLVIPSVTPKMFAKRWKVGTSTYHSWRKKLLAEIQESGGSPFEVIKDEITEDMQRIIAGNPDDKEMQISLIVQSEQLTQIDVFKENGIQILNLALMQMGKLITNEKDLRKLAMLAEKLLPYVLPKADGKGDEGSGQSELERKEANRKRLNKFLKIEDYEEEKSNNSD